MRSQKCAGRSRRRSNYNDLICFHGYAVHFFFRTHFWKNKKNILQIQCHITHGQASAVVASVALSVQEGLEEQNRAGDLVLMSICGRTVHWQ